MKLVETQDIIVRGEFCDSRTWKNACSQVEKAIRATDWPHGSGSFSLNPGAVDHANGVKPIKNPCMDSLESSGWQTQGLPKELAGVQMGNLDALLESDAGQVGFEWETGNISSSHRAINKLLTALLVGGLQGGILVVPSQQMRDFITDRVGNITELRPYIPLWSSIQFENGIFRIYVVEHDQIDDAVPLIPKGKDGMAPKDA